MSGFAQDCPQCNSYLDFWHWITGRPLPEWPIELIKVEKVEYERNENASYCVRPEEMVDTVVIHHSETPTTTTAIEINRMHLNRGTAKDPWYMIGYSYVINSPYQGQDRPTPKITEGRPMNIVGAHAGSSAYVPMDDEQKRLWESGAVKCGSPGQEFRPDPSLIKNGKIKANVTTIGVVVNGNYAPFSQYNPNGYSRNNPRRPTQKTLEMAAKLSCQLQKKWPRIKKISWHSNYKQTTCPGDLKDYIGQIKTIARGLGCEFK